jgi:integrase
MAKLTDRFIISILPPQSGSRIHWDDTLKGFGVRVSASGAKTFIVSYRTLSGRRRSMSLGSCSVLTAARARRRAREILAEAALGGDPAAERERLKQEPTFEHLANEYIDRHASAKRSLAEDIRIIRKDLVEALGPLRISEISRRDVIVLVNAVMDRGAPIMANRTLALLRKMFNFGIEQALTESNPCSRIRRPGKERQRDRVLSEVEITTFWHNLPRTRISEMVQDILKLILITAQRPGEVAGAAWMEFDHAATQSTSPMEPDSGISLWTIPAERSKNGLAHRVPLSRHAIRIIASRPNDGRYLFPSPKDSTKHIRVSSLSHAVRNNVDMLGVDPFTPHDLRRTAASQMAGMGISRLVIARILNHAESGVTAIYDRHSYDNEKREALEAWAERIGEIIDKCSKT